MEAFRIKEVKMHAYTSSIVSASAVLTLPVMGGSLKWKWSWGEVREGTDSGSR